MNQLTSLPQSIGMLNKLQRLSLHINKLGNLPNSMSGLTSLQVCSMFKNKLIDIPDGVLSNWKLCILLALYENELHELPKDIYLMQSLKKLWLNDNRIKVFPARLVEIQSLEEVYYFDNREQSKDKCVGYCQEDSYRNLFHSENANMRE